MPIELDVDALKKQKKCGTCSCWDSHWGKCLANIHKQFATTRDSICHYNPSHWRRHPNPEDSLDHLKEKAYNLAGMDNPNNIDLLKLEIKKLKLYIAQLEKERDAYQKSFQEELATRLDIKKLANKER